jgi:hypothetical protein
LAKWSNDIDFYEGYILNGLKSGKGTYKWINGDKYEGEFVLDKKCG